jgi:PEGA domain-containing protein
VVNARDKSPVEKATAFLSLTETVSLREDGVQGEIQFEKMQPGPYQLHIVAEGYKEFVEDIEVGPEQTSKLVALEPEK